MRQRHMREGDDAKYDDMRGTDGSQDFFGTEFVNRFSGWSVPFQTPHDDAEDDRRSIRAREKRHMN